jgi:hypothetical protein
VKHVFISYSHHDVAFRDALVIHLDVLRRANLITSWHDGELAPGSDWHASIDRQLKDADIIVLLISAHFFASPYCHNTELTHALRRWKERSVHLLPVIVRACDWEVSPLAELQVLPRGATPIAQWDHQDDAWTEVTRTIRALATSTALQGATSSVDAVSILETEPRQPSLRILRSNRLDRRELRFCITMSLTNGVGYIFGTAPAVWVDPHLTALKGIGARQHAHAWLLIPLTISVLALTFLSLTLLRSWRHGRAGTTQIPLALAYIATIPILATTGSLGGREIPHGLLLVVGMPWILISYLSLSIHDAAHEVHAPVELRRNLQWIRGIVWLCAVVIFLWIAGMLVYNRFINELPGEQRMMDRTSFGIAFILGAFLLLGPITQLRRIERVARERWATK